MTWRQAVGVMGQRRFAWYFAARTVSTAGTAMAPVALAFAVLHLTDSGGALAQVLTARTAAMVLFLLVGGVVSDRMSRTTVLQLAHGLTAVTQGTAAVLVISGHADLWMLTGIEALNGAASAFTFPAMAGIVPLVIDRGRLQPANALLAFSRSGLTVVGPAVAGLLVVTVGPGWALAFDAATYLIAILCLWRVKLPARDPVSAPERTSMWAELRDGWSEFASRTWLWVVVVVFGLLNAIHFGALGVLGPLVSSRAPALGADGWGLALSAEALGTVVATVLMLRLSVRHPLRVGMAIAAIAVPIVMLGLSPSTWPLVLAMFVAGSGTEMFGVGWSTAMQQHIPEAVLSRVSSYDALGSFVAMPLGSMVFGLLADRIDPEAVLVVSGILYAALALGTLASRSVRNLRNDPVASPA